MKFLLLATFVALATASGNTNVKNKRQLEAPYTYNVPSSSYGAPVSSFGVPQGSVQTLSYSGSGNIDHLAQPAASFSEGFSASLNSLPSANQVTFSSTAAPDVASLGFSTAAPFDASSFQQSSFQQSSFEHSVPNSVASNGASFQQSSFEHTIPVASNGASFQASPVAYSGFQQSNFGGANSGFDASAVNVASFQASNPSPAAAYSNFEQSSFNSGAVNIPTDNVVQQSGVNSNEAFGVSSHAASSASESGHIVEVGNGPVVEPEVVNTVVNAHSDNVVSQQSGGSLNEAFGVSSHSASSASESADVVEVGNGPVVEPKVIKNVYFYDAPEDEELIVKPRINYEQQQPTKSYKIIFVKAPSYKTNLPIEVPAPPPHEEKTLVYVLVKKPEAQAVINVKSGQAPVQTKPEVFFIKYKTQQEAEEAVAKIQGQQGIQAAGNGFAGGNKASAVDVSTVLSGRAFPEGSTLEGAGVMSEAQANALTVGGVTEAAPVAVSDASSVVSSEVVQEENVQGHAQNSISSAAISSIVGFGQVDQSSQQHGEQVVSVSTDAPVVNSGVFTLSPVTAGPQSFLTGTYNEHQVGLLGSPTGLLQGKFGLSVNHAGSAGASGVGEVDVDAAPVSAEVSSAIAHTEGAAPEVIHVNEDENNVDASSSHGEASAHVQSSVEDSTTVLTTIQETKTSNTEQADTNNTTNEVEDNTTIRISTEEKPHFEVSYPAGINSSPNVAIKALAQILKQADIISTTKGVEENSTVEISTEEKPLAEVSSSTVAVFIPNIEMEAPPQTKINDNQSVSENVVDSSADASENVHIVSSSDVSNKKGAESRFYLPPISPSASSQVESRLYLPPAPIK